MNVRGANISQMTEQEICEEAVRKFGETRQMLQCVEECGELVQAVVKYVTERQNVQRVLEEVADMEICLKQIRIMHDAQTIDRARIEQLKKLKSYL